MDIVNDSKSSEMAYIGNAKDLVLASRAREESLGGRDNFSLSLLSFSLMTSLIVATAAASVAPRLKFPCDVAVGGCILGRSNKGPEN